MLTICRVLQVLIVYYNTARNATTDNFLLLGRTGTTGLRDDERQPNVPFKTANAISTGEDSLRPGEQYPIYNSQDILGSLPEDLELLNSTAARWAGVEPVYVSSVVERFERRVARWWETVRRRERGEEPLEEKP